MKQEFCFSFYENLASIHTIEYQWSGVRTTYEEMVSRIFALQKKEGFKAYSEKRCIVAYPRAGITLKLCDYAFPTVYVCINPRILSGDDHSYRNLRRRLEQMGLNPVPVPADVHLPVPSLAMIVETILESGYFSYQMDPDALSASKGA